MADTFKFELSGIVSFKMDDVGPAGTMGTMATQYTGIKDGTMTFDIAAPTSNDINIEESDFPYATLLSGSAKSFSFELLGLKLSELPAFLGGNFTAGTGGERDKWAAPSTIPNILQSVQIVSKDSLGNAATYSYVQCRVSGHQSQTNAKTDLIGLQLTFSITQPLDGEGEPTTPYFVEGETSES